MNEKELKNNTLPVVTGSTDKKEITLIRGVGQRQIRQTYNFDSVFTSFSNQSEVFETVRPLIAEVMQGFEATVRRAGLCWPAALPRCALHPGLLLCRTDQPWHGWPARRCLRTARPAPERLTPWRASWPPTSSRASFRVPSR